MTVGWAGGVADAAVQCTSLAGGDGEAAQSTSPVNQKYTGTMD
jgi:hypothetical protein